MARLSDELINRIKTEVNLVHLIESQGHKLEKQGRDYVVRCPFHDDRTPSCVITPRKNLWHCLGACQAGGSVIDWVMKTEGLAFREAVKKLSQHLSGVVVEAEATPDDKEKNNVTPIRDTLHASDDDQTLLQAVFAHYHETLKHSESGLAYLDKRGLKDPALIEHFKLGHADQSLMNRRLPRRGSQASTAVREQLKHVGLVMDSGHEFFKGSLVVPIRDEDGTIQQAYGRKLLEKTQNNPIVHRYLPGAREVVWHGEAVKGTQEIILCESLIDAMTFWVNGFRHVLASYGINGFTEAHSALFIEAKIQRVLIAYDSDAAGNQAALALAEKLQTHGMACFRLVFPKGMDANEYAVKVQPAHKSLGLVISKAQYLGKGEAPMITSIHDQAVVLDPLDLAVNREVAREMQTAQRTPPLRLLTNPAAAKKENSTTATPAEPAHDTDTEQATSSLAAIAADVPPTSERDAGDQQDETAPQNDERLEINGQEITVHYGPRRYRVRGLEKNQTYEHLKIHLLASGGEHCFVDHVDLYSAKHRSFFIKQAALELGEEESVIKRDVGRLLLLLEDRQLQQIDNTLRLDKPVVLTPEEEQEALAFLQSPDLLIQIIDDFNACGVVGEEVNKLTGYLACVSRHLKKPLAVVIQSSSAAGKSSLMDAVLAMVPEEQRIHYSAMTGQSLFYMGKTNLKHKILAIAEEEGAANASYALKLLQSEGEITMASTGKNPTTGQLETQDYKVEGPVMLFLTTTSIDIDEELLNRCLVLSVNESREQTEAIHAIQRDAQTLEGLLRAHSKKRLLQKHQNAQRLLRSIHVTNPFAQQLTFLSDKTRTRRDHMKYLQLINAVTLLHQYQREVKTITHEGDIIDYIEATAEDIAIANTLAHAILGRSLDELPPQTRRLLDLIDDMVQSVCRQDRFDQSDYRFTRRDIRQFTGWSDGQLKIHCKRLEDMEYLLVHTGKRGQSLQYELLYSGASAAGHLILTGLIDTDRLGVKNKTITSLQKKLGLNPSKSAPSQAQVSPKSGASQTLKNGKDTMNTVLNAHSSEKPLESAYIGKNIRLSDDAVTTLKG